MAVNQAVLDATIRHSVFLEQLKAGEVEKFAPFLKEIDRAVREQLTNADLSEYNIKRLNQLLDEVDSLLLGIFDRYITTLNLDLIDLANYEAQFEATALSRSAPVGVTFDAVVAPARAIRSAVLNNPLRVRDNGGGKLLKPFIKDWASTERERVSGAPSGKDSSRGRRTFRSSARFAVPRQRATATGYWRPQSAMPVQSCTQQYSALRHKLGWRPSRPTRTLSPRLRSLQRSTAKQPRPADRWINAAFPSILGRAHRFTSGAGRLSCP